MRERHGNGMKVRAARSRVRGRARARMRGATRSNMSAAPWKPAPARRPTSLHSPPHQAEREHRPPGAAPPGFGPQQGPAGRGLAGPAWLDLPVARRADFALAAVSSDAPPPASLRRLPFAACTWPDFTWPGFTWPGFTWPGTRRRVHMGGFHLSAFTWLGFPWLGFPWLGFTRRDFTRRGLTRRGFTRRGFTWPRFTWLRFTWPDSHSRLHLAGFISADSFGGLRSARSLGRSGAVRRFDRQTVLPRGHPPAAGRRTGAAIRVSRFARTPPRRPPGLPVRGTEAERHAP